VDELVNSFYAAGDLTIQWCVMSEALDASTHPKGPHSKGPLFGGQDSGRISVHHNLLAHNVGRNPMIKATGIVDVVNNVMLSRPGSRRLWTGSTAPLRPTSWGTI
jgi:hypothetical protein